MPQAETVKRRGEAEGDLVASLGLKEHPGSGGIDLGS